MGDRREKFEPAKSGGGEKLKCYVFGAGREYDRLSTVLPLYKQQINILGIVTSQRQPFSMLDNYPCLIANEMDISNLDYVIIAVAEWYPVAYFLVHTVGISAKKLILSSVFFYHNFDIREYIKLKNSNVSILSNNCLGGIIYKQLGLKALSPTIGTLCRSGKEYITFVNNYRYYLQYDMEVFSDDMIQSFDKMISESNFHYPKGCIEDEIVWLFPHETYARNGVEAWNRRRRRINPDNIVVLMAIINDEDAIAFSQLPLKRKLGFYYKDLHLKDIIFIPEWNREEIWAESSYDFSRHTIRRNNPSFAGPIQINWIKFLNGRKDYLRYV